MRKILFALVGLTVSYVMGDVGVCQKNCGIDYGKCLIQTFDMATCLKQEAACALDCLKSLVVAAEEHHHHGDLPVVKGSGEVCQKNCGIDYGKCLIQTFDMATCLKQEAACALDCLKGVAFVAKWDVPCVQKVTGKDQGVCQKNCGIDMGKCIITTGNVAQCMKDEAACALDCLKSVAVESNSKHLMQNSGEICQKNCGIDYGKCLIQTFDMATCLKQEAACALDCLKSVQTPKVSTLKCTGCQYAAGKIEGVIAKYGCRAADGPIVGACELFLGGPEDPLADICAVGFVKACPTLAGWIEKKVFSPVKACQLIHMC